MKKHGCGLSLEIIVVVRNYLRAAAAGIALQLGILLIRVATERRLEGDKKQIHRPICLGPTSQYNKQFLFMFSLLCYGYITQHILRTRSNLHLC